LHYPEEVVLLLVLWRLRYKLSLRGLNNPIEPMEADHRGIKARYKPMLGFKTFASASRFCSAYDEVRNYLRDGHNLMGSLANNRANFGNYWLVILKISRAIQ